MSEIKRIQDLVVKEVKSEYKYVSDDAIKLAVKRAIFLAQDWVSIQEQPAPAGVHLMVSVDGIHSAGFLCNKHVNGDWYDCFNRKITVTDQIKYWRYPIIDVEA